jgi:hypothetical protein
MNCLPIVSRELRVAARKRGTFWVRVAAAATALVIGTGFFLLSLMQGTRITGMGSELFTVLTWLSLAVGMSAGLFFTSDGLSEEKREGTLGLEYFFNAEEHWQGWTHRPKLSRGSKYWSVAMTAPAGQKLRELAESFNAKEWQAAAWQAADGEKRATRLAWKEIYLHSDLEEKSGEWPPCWLVADWPEGQKDPYHVYVAWLKQPPAKGRTLRLSRGPWPIEQYFQRGKDDLGLDHYEGRSWRGFHHHLTMSAIAYLFVVVDYLRAKKNFRPDVGTGVASDAAIARAFTWLLSLLSDGI